MGYIRAVLLLSVVFVLSSGVVCDDDVGSNELFSNELVEEGRTFVHHAIKRLAIILPAVFFKLGIAFTMLILVTIVAVNNGFIGFLLLVVGLSTVLARLQDSRKSVVPVPISYLPQPHVGHHHILDRSDNVAPTQEPKPTHGTLNNPAYASSTSYTVGPGYEAAGYVTAPNYNNVNTGFLYNNRYYAANS